MSNDNSGACSNSPSTPIGKPGKTFNDPVHGHIELPPLCIKIVDTPQFQRLRNIKQLGGSYFVFPGASHNRFEHSLGVCYLAGKMVRQLKKRQPELKITDEDVLCVQIAGLCHDLGHGPFSHMFDGKFMPKFFNGVGEPWKHEKASLDMFDHLLKENNLLDELTDYNIKVIKDMILSPKDKPGVKNKDTAFLYEIVSNSRNSIDVDKWDYFARDCHHLGITNSFDHSRLMLSARVIAIDGVTQICYRDKEVLNLYDMFYTRMSLHRRAYQHRVTKAIEHMVVDAMVKADEHIKFVGRKGKQYKISECISDMVAYTKLTDHIFDQILISVSNELKDSRTILGNILKRNLYRFVGHTHPYPKKSKVIKIDEMCKEIADGAGMPIHDIIVETITLDYGCKTDNPIDKVHFYQKNKLDVAYLMNKVEVSHMLPDVFCEEYLCVLSKNSHPEKVKKAWTSFQEWGKRNGLETKQPAFEGSSSL